MLTAIVGPDIELFGTKCRKAQIQKLTLTHRVAKEREVAQTRRFKMRYLVDVSLADAAGWDQESLTNAAGWESQSLANAAGLDLINEFLCIVKSMTTNRVDTLRRFAGANHRVESGEGLKPDHFVPVCSIRSRELAAKFKEQLMQQDIEVKIHRERLCTRFFVTHQNLSTALQIHEALLAKHPDEPARKFSRDYDSVLLLTPPTALVLVVIVFAKPQSNVWVGVLSTSITAMVILERLNRLYRNNRGAKWGIIDLIGITLAVAVNVAVWKFVV